jgi:hypothetical protein
MPNTQTGMAAQAKFVQAPRLDPAHADRRTSCLALNYHCIRPQKGVRDDRR